MMTTAKHILILLLLVNSVAARAEDSKFSRWINKVKETTKTTAQSTWTSAQQQAETLKQKGQALKAVASQVGHEANQRFKSISKDKLNCSEPWKILAYAGAGVAAAGAASYVAYNIPYSKGEWKNIGSEAQPIWVPETGEQINLVERRAALTLPMRQQLWVHGADKKGFGRVYYDADAVQYYKGGDIVAQSDPITEEGRPWHAPTSIGIRDNRGNLIGTIQEHSDEISDGVHQVYFSVLDSQGNLLAKTDTHQENDQGVILSESTQVGLSDADGSGHGKYDQTGGNYKRFTWDLKKKIDPRLLIILSGYQSKLRKARGG